MDVIGKLNAIAKIGVSQRALAQRLNISETTVCRWYKGERKPNAANLIFLSLKFPDFFNNDEVMKWLSRK